MKVWMVWEGDYANRFPALFATRDLAEAHIEPELQREYASLPEAPHGGWDSYRAEHLRCEVIEMDVYG